MARLSLSGHKIASEWLLLFYDWGHSEEMMDGFSWGTPLASELKLLCADDKVLLHELRFATSATSNYAA